LPTNIFESGNGWGGGGKVAIPHRGVIILRIGDDSKERRGRMVVYCRGGGLKKN